MINIWTIGLPIPVGLAITALVGYLIGRRWMEWEPENPHLRHDLKRARRVVRSLERIAAEVRSDFNKHQRSVDRFRKRLRQLTRLPDRSPSWQELADEAEQLLRPTLRLATQMAHAYDEVRQQANLLMSFTEVRTDPLTGLCNRRALDDTLNKMFALMSRYSNIFSLAMFDIDHFKTINDEQGHLCGDQILQEVARIFGQCARETDMVARFGGEEFLVIMPETELPGAMILAERVRHMVAAQLNVTISGGIATALDGDTPQSLISRADEALYQAKAEGRNRTYCHTGEGVERALTAARSQLAGGASTNRLPTPPFPDAAYPTAPVEPRD